MLLSDTSKACNGTLVSSAAAALISSTSDVISECQTGGSIRLALVAVLAFIVIPIPFLLLFVDADEGRTQAIEFAQRHKVAAQLSTVTSIEEIVSPTTVDHSVPVPDNSAAPASASQQSQ